MKRWTLTLFWTIVLVVVFLFGAAAIVHFSRRYRAYLLRDKKTPTATDDVWAMHQVPVELKEEYAGDDSDIPFGGEDDTGDMFDSDDDDDEGFDDGSLDDDGDDD